MTDDLQSVALSRTDEALASFQFEPGDAAPSPGIDRWMLASNLQKAIRRGLPSTAALSAHWLHDLDPVFTWRRLQVIAFEDVGLADETLCHDVLEVSRCGSFQRDRGKARVASLIAWRLASAPKNRSLCHISAVCQMELRRDEFRVDLERMGDDDLTEIACNAEAATSVRAAALCRVAGYRVATYGVVHAYAKAIPGAMDVIADRLGLSSLQRSVYQAGQRRSEGMNAFVPLVADHMPSDVSEHRSFRFEGSRGILFCAADRHTRMGNRCASMLLERARELRDFFSLVPRPVSALTGVLFFVEGSLLDRQCAGGTHDRWARRCEVQFLESCGLEPRDHAEAKRLVVGFLPELNSIRGEQMS